MLLYLLLGVLGHIHKISNVNACDVEISVKKHDKYSHVVIFFVGTHSRGKKITVLSVHVY